jgi:hypothetical protein
MVATLLVGLLGLIVLVVVIGWLLPREITVERSIAIDRPPEAIYPWMADLKKWPECTVLNRNEDPSLVYTYSGADAGAGAAMAWTAKKMGGGQLTITAAQPGQYLRYALQMTGRSMTVRGNIEIESAGGGATLVLWFDTVDFGWRSEERRLGKEC